MGARTPENQRNGGVPGGFPYRVPSKKTYPYTQRYVLLMIGLFGSFMVACLFVLIVCFGLIGCFGLFVLVCLLGL